MRRVYMKIGTHPQKVVFVGFKQHPPRRGDTVRIKEGTDPNDSRRPTPGVRWTRVKIDEIRNLAEGPLFFASRW